MKVRVFFDGFRYYCQYRFMFIWCNYKFWWSEYSGSQSAVVVFDNKQEAIQFLNRKKDEIILKKQAKTVRGCLKKTKSDIVFTDNL